MNFPYSLTAHQQPCIPSDTCCLRVLLRVDTLHTITAPFSQMVEEVSHLVKQPSLMLEFCITLHSAALLPWLEPSPFSKGTKFPATLPKRKATFLGLVNGYEKHLDSPPSSFDGGSSPWGFSRRKPPPVLPPPPAQLSLHSTLSKTAKNQELYGSRTSYNENLQFNKNLIFMMFSPDRYQVRPFPLPCS